MQGTNRSGEGGEKSVKMLSLGRRLVNLLPVAQRTNAFVDRPWVVGRDFESRVHH